MLFHISYRVTLEIFQFGVITESPSLPITLSRFSRTPMIDGQADTQTQGRSKYHTSIASHGKNDIQRTRCRM